MVEHFTCVPKCFLTTCAIVDQFIGTANGGHVFAGAYTAIEIRFYDVELLIGATLPFGSVKAVADCNSWDNQGEETAPRLSKISQATPLGGYVSDGSGIRGISPLHDDGTG